MFSFLRLVSSCTLVLLGVGIVTGASAQDRRNENGFLVGPPLGCYERIWSNAELNESPQQILNAMRVRVIDRDGGPSMWGRYMVADILLADQGLARQMGLGGRRFINELPCAPGYKREYPFCYATCGPDRMVFPKLGPDGMVFQIGDFFVTSGAVCGEDEIDLAGGRKGKVAYRLDRVADSQCEGL